MNTRYIACALSVAALLSATAHPGGLDKNGGHRDKKTGTYHVHRPQPAQGGTGAQNAPVPTPAIPNRAVPPGAGLSSSTNATVSADRWISSTGKRHNSKCRYYGSTKGRAGTSAEGTACSICGG
jgi:hypothetical protein